MKPAVWIIIACLCGAGGFASGWAAHTQSAPVLHVVVDDIPFMTATPAMPRRTKADMDKPAHDLNVASCILLGIPDRKTGQIKYPHECDQYKSDIAAAVNHAKQ